ncbi:hypothetical protein [Streptomyces sp. NPDC048191]|uniref:hypothetical protein n=1 Tax=Streptomyces sp. NPDC048191 TaxID=3155484 RepID=UPI0033F6C691
MDDEAEMDSEAVYAMAPDADQLMVIGRGCDEDQALLDAALAVLTGDGHHPGASLESNSGYIASTSHGRPGPYRTMVNAGTSLACPLIVGLVADAQQGRKSAFGFINPLIYRLAGTRAFHDVLPVGSSMPQQDRAAHLPAGGAQDGTGIDVFDSQEHAQTQQVTAKGHDTMTGVGSPNGAAFVTGLRHAAR